MVTEIFNRKELKYVVSDTQKRKIVKSLEPHMSLDKYNLDGELYRIFNLYIDTDDHQLIRNSLSKPKYKEKIRIRSYCDFEPDSIVFLEVKKRLGKHTNKRRTCIEYREALDFVSTGKKPPIKDYMNKQVIEEFAFFLNQAKYHPKTFITYDRLALHSKDNPNLRITFDTNLITKRYGTDETKNILPKNHWILEIKSVKNMPIWLTKILTENQAFRQSYSKYGNEYKVYLKENIKGGK